MKNKYLMLFANCIITKGKQRSIISDLQRNKYRFIPNSMANLFDKNNRINVIKIKKELDREGNEIIDEYITFLLNKGLAFYTNSKKECSLYPPLSLDWDYSAKISNIILVLSKKYILDLKKFFSEIEALNCRYIQIRISKDISINYFHELLNFINKSSLYSVQIDLQSNFLSIEELTDLIQKNRKIQLFNIFDSLKNELLFFGNEEEGKIVTTKQKFSFEKSCGIIHHNYFTVNIESYTESLSCNSCLNRKLSIDENGQIKNCPNMKESFGDISNTKLAKIVDSDEFTKYWYITKDNIDVCKGCEFRNICSDCRAFIEEPDNILSKPLKCGYNPDTTEWEDWYKSPLKEKAIEFYEFKS